MSTKVLAAALCAVAVVACVWVWEQEKRIGDAHTKLERAEETARRVKDLEAERVWQRLDDAAQALEPEMPEPHRKEAVERLKQEIQRVKGRIRHEQLGVGR